MSTRPPLRLSIPDYSDTTHDDDETIIIIGLNSQNLTTRRILLATHIIVKSRTRSSPSRAATQRSGTTHMFGAKLTVEAFSSVTNSL